MLDSSALLGVLKLNFDGASKGIPGPAGFGCVVRDSNGVVLWVCVGPLDPSDALKAEIFGLLIGLRNIHNLDVSKIIIEEDSAVVICWVKGNVSCSWRYSHLIQKIKDKLDRLD